MIQNENSKNYDDVHEILNGVLQKMNIQASVRQSDFLDAPYFQIETRDNTLLIGENGQHLYALQTFVKRVVEQRRGGLCPPFLIDVNSYQRRIIHMALMEDPDVVTESAGEGEHRRVVIKPVHASGFM